MLLDQHVNELTNQLETKKTHKWWSSQTSTEQSWVYIDMNGRL